METLKKLLAYVLLNTPWFALWYLVVAWANHSMNAYTWSPEDRLLVGVMGGILPAALAIAVELNQD